MTTEREESNDELYGDAARQAPETFDGKWVNVALRTTLALFEESLAGDRHRALLFERPLAPRVRARRRVPSARDER